MTPETLATVHQAAFTITRPWSAAEFAGLLEQRGVILCGDAKSYLLGRIIGDEAEVLTLATNPAFQRQGRAQTVLATFLDQVKADAGAHVFLEVADTNTAAISLYNKARFAKIGHRPRYYTTLTGDKIGADVLRLTF